MKQLLDSWCANVIHATRILVGIPRNNAEYHGVLQESLQADRLELVGQWNCCLPKKKGDGTHCTP